MNPNLEARLREIARQQGRDLQSVVEEALQTFADATPRSNGAPKTTGPKPAADHAVFMQGLRQRQRERGMRPTPASEVAAYLRSERAAWDD